MKKLDTRICNAIKRLDEYFGKYKYVICGSVGLYLQGIDLGREPHDFDLFIPGESRKRFQRLWDIAYSASGFMLDFPFRPLEGKEEILNITFHGLDVKVQSKANIIQCKNIIVDKHLYYDKGEKKQKQDIEKLKELNKI